jgi:hypothetical protein
MNGQNYKKKINDDKYFDTEGWWKLVNDAGFSCPWQVIVHDIILWYLTGARMGRPNASLNSLHFLFLLGSLFVNLLQAIQFREKKVSL